MTPDELAKSGSEHGTQRALFAWARMAEQFGFAAAWDDRSYGKDGTATLIASVAPGLAHWAAVPELRWLHAIPNGGKREGRTGAQMKAEGVKRGICDVFLPLPAGHYGAEPCGYLTLDYAGLYVEMKKAATMKPGVRKAEIINTAAGTTSDEQSEFIGYARHVGYAVSVCFDWRSAAKEIQRYIEWTRRTA